MIGKDNKISVRDVTEGLCLRRLDYGNTSQVASFLTPDSGRVDCIFKGAWRSPKKGIATGLDIPCRYKLVYRPSSSGSLDTLLECSMIEHFSGLRCAVERAICGYYAIELMRDFTTYAQGCREFYSVVLKSLRRFAAGYSLGLGALELEIAALKHYGSCPDFSSCCACTAGWNDEDPFLFSSLKGGVLCRKCSKGKGSSLNTDQLPLKKKDAVLILAQMCQSGNSTLETANPALVVSASRILRYHIRWLLGKELCMWKYLHSRHYSRTMNTLRSGPAN